MACRPRAGGLAEGFDKADARNLPRVDIMMIVDFFQQDRHPAMKQTKMQRLVVLLMLLSDGALMHVCRKLTWMGLWFTTINVFEPLFS